MQDTTKQESLTSKNNPEQWRFSFLTSAPFMHFLDLMPEAAILSTTSGQIILTNTTAQQLFQYSEHEFLQCSIEDLVPKKVKAIHPKFRAHFLKILSLDF